MREKIVIGTDVFWCVNTGAFELSGDTWYPSSGIGNNGSFGIDGNKSFDTKEECETYLRKCIKKKCKDLLRGLSGKMVSTRGGFNKKV